MMMLSLHGFIRGTEPGLGREKRRRLLAAGVSRERLESTYRVSRRIEAEERALDAAAAVVASTRQKAESQYAVYDNHDPGRMVVIPPGVDLDRFRPPRRGEPEPPIAAEIDRFLEHPRRPTVLALARPEERKNLRGLDPEVGPDRIGGAVRRVVDEHREVAHARAS